MNGDPFEIAPEILADGQKMWRAEVWREGRLVDASRLVATPREAISDGFALVAETYWVRDNNLPYTTAA